MVGIASVVATVSSVRVVALIAEISVATAVAAILDAAKVGILCAVVTALAHPHPQALRRDLHHVLHHLS